MDRLLIKAVLRNDVEEAQTLVESSYNLNEKDNEGKNPLIYASIARYYEIVELLLNAGCNSNETDDLGQTPLMFAVRNEDLEMVRLLLKYGADVNLKASFGKTALDMAQGKQIRWEIGPFLFAFNFPYWWKENEIMKTLLEHQELQLKR